MLRSISIVLCWTMIAMGSLIKVGEINRISTVDSMALTMIATCYSDHKAVVVHSDSNADLMESLLKSQSISVVTHNTTVTSAALNLQQMSLFIVSVESKTQTQEKLLFFKHSSWWNVTGTHLMLDRSSENCANAHEILQSAWKINLLIAVFLCVDSHDNPYMYTYNPYSNHAPDVWQSLNTTSTGWTLYNRNYQRDNICDGLNFDRTKHLDGHTIKLVDCIGNLKDSPWLEDTEYDERTLKSLEFLIDARTAESFKIGLNTSLRFHFVEFIASNNRTLGLYKRLSDQSSDLALCLRIEISPGYIPSYPIIWSTDGILSHRGAKLTPLEKIWKFYGMLTLLYTIFVLTVTFYIAYITSKTSRRNGHGAFATFEIIRLLTNTSLFTRMNTFPLRLFFFTVFYYFIIIQATFQGNLASFLTKDDYQPHAKSLNDLRDFNDITTVYVPVWLSNLIDDPVLQKKLKLIDHPNCTNFVRTDPSAACYNDVNTLREGHTAVDDDLRVTETALTTLRYVYVMREDWPLRQRIDIAMMWLEQAMLSMERVKNFINSYRAEMKRRIANMTLVRVIKLKDLSFAFVFLGTGLFFSTICFALERRFGSVKRKKQRQRVAPQSQRTIERKIRQLMSVSAISSGSQPAIEIEEIPRLPRNLKELFLQNFAQP